MAISPNQKVSTGSRGRLRTATLSVFLVHGKDRIKGQTFLTLEEALIQKKVIVRETREVSRLTIQNVSTEEVYVQSGDIVKGGAQDRMLVVDLILPPTFGARFRSTPFALKTAVGARAETKRRRCSVHRRTPSPAAK